MMAAELGAIVVFFRIQSIIVRKNAIPMDSPRYQPLGIAWQNNGGRMIFGMRYTESEYAYVTSRCCYFELTFFSHSRCSDVSSATISG